MSIKKSSPDDAIRHYFCLDVGGTSTRGALFSPEGKELARLSGAAGALSLGAKCSAQAILAVWQQLGEAVNEDVDAHRTALWAGIAGISLAGHPAELREHLKAFARVGLVSDGYAALLGATGGKPGALISVGTGVIAQRLYEDGKTLALGGWGLPAGDMGGGAWMGLELFGALSKYVDGVTLTLPLPEGLADAIMDITGRSYGQIQHWHHNATARDFAALAPLAVALSARGDAFCTNLLASAAREIVALGRALFVGTSPGAQRQSIHLTGGLGTTLEALCARQAPEFIWNGAPVDPVAGICLLPRGRAPMEEVMARPRLRADRTGPAAARDEAQT